MGERSGSCLSFFARPVPDLPRFFHSSITIPPFLNCQSKGFIPQKCEQADKSDITVQ